MCFNSRKTREGNFKVIILKYYKGFKLWNFDAVCLFLLLKNVYLRYIFT